TEAISKLDNVRYISRTIEEIAFFEYNNNQDFGVIKGVDQYYPYINDIDSTIIEGQYYLNPDDQVHYAVIGAGVRNKLAVSIDNDFERLKIYMPKRGRVGNFEDPFRRMDLKPIAAFSIQQDFDSKYVISDLGFAQNLIDVSNKISSYEIRLNDNTLVEKTKARIQDILGTEFKILSKYEQDASFLRIMNIEKWVGYALLLLTFLLVAFNIVGALWMIVLEKRSDITVFKALGATEQQLGRIFIHEGFLLCLSGIIIGVIISLIVYFLQIRYALIATPNGFAYPISFKFVDFVFILLAVIGISLLAAVPAARKAKSIAAYFRNE
ncbi:MAG: FtsX-like permease family protein, partial [Bacteroidia bacterium]|nr:FtsX-like permease family protein [Bacteroidia bacterium]